MICLLLICSASCGGGKSPIGDRGELRPQPLEIYVEIEEEELAERVTVDPALEPTDRHFGHPAHPGTPVRDWDLFTAQTGEKPGYSLYTYVLFGSPPVPLDRPDPAVSKRRIFTLEGITRKASPRISSQKSGNLFYLPGALGTENGLRSSPSYDMTLSNRFLAALARLMADGRGPAERMLRRPGPFFISLRKTMERTTQESVLLLFADLSDSELGTLKKAIGAYRMMEISHSEDDLTVFNNLRLRLFNILENPDENLRLIRVSTAGWSL